jgi:hypothetical protein
MKNQKDEKIIYSINIADIQEVAEEYLERRLTKSEIAKVQNSVGDYINWSQAIEFAIDEHNIE